jgi:hypothetical protein
MEPEATGNSPIARIHSLIISHALVVVDASSSSRFVAPNSEVRRGSLRRSSCLDDADDPSLCHV